MKNIYNKIYATLKRWHIFSWQQFKERKQQRLERKEYLKLIGDWYYQHSWFERKWFLHKLKRVIMKNLLNVFRKFKNLTLENYYAELRFVNEFETYEGMLPFYISAESFEQADKILTKIGGELTKTYGFSISHRDIKDKPCKKSDIDQIIAIKKFGGIAIGTIQFNSYVGTSMQVNELIPFNSNVEDLGNFKKQDDEFLNFIVLKNDMKPFILPNKEFKISIRVLMDVGVINPTGTEIDWEYAKYLSNYKPKK